MQINHDKFFDAYREAFGSLTQEQVDGLNELLTELEADKEWDMLLDAIRRQQVAYVLATFLHEAAATWRPIAEYGKGEGHSYGDPDPETGEAYYGRGYVQSTWRENYEKLTAAWNGAYPAEQVDFVIEPDLLLEAHYAYFAGAYGMRSGLYTGVGLVTYINESECDYYNARKIVNALDKAELIAGYAKSFEDILEKSEETMLTEDQAPIADGIYDVKEVYVTNNPDGTVKVDLIIPKGSYLVTLGGACEVSKEKV